MLILLLLPLIPICIYIMKTKTPEEIRRHNEKTKRAVKCMTAGAVIGTALAIKDGDKQ